MRNIAIVTGASSGIGEAFVRELINERGVYGSLPFQEIWIIARREEKLQALKAELDPERIVVIPADLAEPSEMQVVEDMLAERKDDICVGLIINCAGVGKRGLVEDKSAQVLEDTVDINCTCLSKLTHICLPYMIDRLPVYDRGDGPRIINIASSAAFLPQPGFAAYAASKAYVVSFSRALDIELMRYNIAVTTVCPGPVKTGFQILATDGKEAEFTGFRGLVAADPVKLARKVLKASRKGRHLYVYGISQKALHVVSKIVPTYWILRLENKFSYVPSEYEIARAASTGPVSADMYDPITMNGYPSVQVSADAVTVAGTADTVVAEETATDTPVAITTDISTVSAKTDTEEDVQDAAGKIIGN